MAKPGCGRLLSKPSRQILWYKLVWTTAMLGACPARFLHMSLRTLVRPTVSAVLVRSSRLAKPSFARKFGDCLSPMFLAKLGSPSGLTEGGRPARGRHNYRLQKQVHCETPTVSGSQRMASSWSPCLDTMAATLWEVRVRTAALCSVEAFGGPSFDNMPPTAEGKTGKASTPTENGYGSCCQSLADLVRHCRSGRSTDLRTLFGLRGYFA